MNRILKVTLILALLPLAISAQHIELGLSIGTANYMGDLSPRTSRFSFGNIHTSAGIFGRYNFNDFVTAKLGASYGNVSGYDSKSNVEFQQNRNLSFESHIAEGALTVEFNILGFQPYNLNRPFSPYIFAGIAFFNFKPTANLNGEWYDLQPLNTEGQGLSEFPDRTPYKLTDISIPFGGGIKYAINDKWNIGLEVGLRKTLTDYLDDVSLSYVEDALILENYGAASAALANRTGTPVATGDPRGNAENDDWYMLTGVTVSYNFLDNGLVGRRNRSRKKAGCNF